MDDHLAIKVDGVSKKFSRSLNKAMFYGLKDIMSNMRGRSSNAHVLRDKEFWAVDDVSFEVKKGETVGLIGPNGSGKTTFLKMLNGIFWPDTGKISIRGRIGALIAVGAGFHPMLTGRENIYSNAAILGMNRRQVDKQFDKIVAFANIGDFLDTPVKNYSSGMFVRLGFAIAVHCEPDVLLVDEVLAVGDEGFRAKCYEKIAELKESCTIIFVSHNMNAIARICDRVILFNKSRMIFCGNTDEGVEQYQNLFAEEGVKIQSLGTGEATIENFTIRNETGDVTDKVEHGKDVQFNFTIKVDKAYDQFVTIVAIAAKNGQSVAQCHSDMQGNTFTNSSSGVQNMTVNISKFPFKPGQYYINIVVFDAKTRMRHLVWHTRYKEFEVIGKYFAGAHVQLASRWEQKKL